MRRGIVVLYLGTFILFGAVVLWAERAAWPLVPLFGAFALLLVAALALDSGRGRTVLVVGERSEGVESIDRALEGDGYEVCSCAGPGNRPCPVFQGRGCPLGERPLAAVIYHPAGDRGRYAPCGRALGVRALIVEEHLDTEAERIGPVARVGLDHDPDRVVRTMRALLAS
jgi:hypothetical protein